MKVSPVHLNIEHYWEPYVLFGYCEKYLYPHTLIQNFTSNFGDDCGDYLDELEIFQTNYLTPRQKWLRKMKHRVMIRYSAVPHYSGQGGFFILVIFFAEASDAISYKQEWNSLQG